VATNDVADTLVAVEGDPEPGARTRLSRPTIAGHEVGELIGKGGMGEVRQAHDPKIGRNVAIKRLRAAHATPEAVDRFLREARIQARLDHPAIVPVHILGEDAEGRPYFTMKQLAGTTLYEVLLRKASLQTLLRAFIDVCLAIEFAHERGVVHRDLKPSNIMLGDYGEVYVLDWGIARVIGDREGGAGQPGDITTLEGNTQVGAMLGTPGYMAPEQVRGEADVGRAADIYALGSILFEMLAGVSLHPSGDAAIASTLATPTVAPAQRRPDRPIAPELDAACTAALAADPSLRPTARELADRVQRYLDGDRDLERRRALAAEHLAHAKQALADPSRRAEAIRIAGNALVLDPQSSEAAALVMSLMIEPPRELPTQLAAQLQEFELQLGVRTARTAAWSLLSYLAFVPLVLWAGGVDWAVFVPIYAVVLLSAGHSAYQVRARRPSAIIPLVLNGVLMVLFSRVFGPFVLVPGIIGMYTATLVAQPEVMDRPWLIIAIALASLVAPFALEATGVMASTWHLIDGAIVIDARALHLGGTPTTVILIAGNLGIVLFNGLLGRSIAASRRDALRRLEIQAWHLRQLLPVEPPHPG